MKHLNELLDSELFDLIKKDQEQALSMLYNRYWDRLLAVAMHRLDSMALAEECVQDVFLSLWKRRHDLQLKYSMATYLSVAVKYQVITQLDLQYRHAQRMEHFVFAQQGAQYASSTDEALLEKEMLERITGVINRLPEKCRLVFTMSREEGMPNKQIAAELGIAEKTVEAHMSRALRDLRSDLITLSPFMLAYFFLK